MPVDYRQLHARIKEIGAGAKERGQKIEERRKRARELLATYANQLDFLRAKVDSAKAIDANIRCALPAKESLLSHYAITGSAKEAMLIAADGSQITPDRHASVLYSLINIGVIIFKPGSGDAPDVKTFTELKYGDDLYSNHGLMTEDLIVLGRDLSEREKLLDLGAQYPKPVITLTDGPIELWGAEGSAQEDYRRNRERHLAILSQMQSENIITAGYIDKPAAALVTRLLEISQIQESDMKNVRDIHPLRGVTDRWLFGQEGNALLKKGERSALFVIQSSSRNHYRGQLEIHFFYLNVGSDRHPWIVRVEIPAWVAEDKEKANILHASLIQQCEIMGAKPYPYLLHRAHETALVKMEERQQIEQMLMQELRNQGEDVDEGSYKQSAKDLKGRTR
ncbi:MAG TPA: DNA double-strand break repair nuclease NurA [Anaerolineales bacterium]|nr:DNA double-strand break repair nuclease NurA [Anaerolineales bacterium]